MTALRKTYGRPTDVHIIDEFMTASHRLIVLGRDHEGRRCILTGAGEWEPVREGSDHSGIYLPEGVLDAIVAKYRGTTPAQPATERHLDDAIAVRDRLLKIVEDRPLTIVTGEAHVVEREA